jgi:S-adenosylmethionine:tRNA ribosyltransferase-isomerase
MTDRSFRDLSDLLQVGDLLVFNNAKVIHARLPFAKPTGGLLELFCLEPTNLSVEQGLASRGEVVWNCLVGGAKKWKSGKIHLVGEKKGIQELSASLEMKQDEHFEIRFEWSPPELTWGEVVEEAGQIPLPPYIRREAEEDDQEDYQTVYAHVPGSVAAPTAGLHFSEAMMTRIKEKGVATAEVTLHVGAGTFKPVSSSSIGDHVMHGESVSVSKSTMEAIRDAKRVIAVGTTTTRSLESLYWVAQQQMDLTAPINIGQWTAYEGEATQSRQEAMDQLIADLDSRKLNSIQFVTDIMCTPAYSMRMIDGLLTNFHMPKSTLLLLIASMIGEDWKVLYSKALKENYRFLSYGDSSILIP